MLSPVCASPCSYLNQINTQSTLLASCATAMLGAGELNAMEDEVDNIFRWPLNATYILGTVSCLACSLWVIYTAMNLINLSIHSTLYGETMREIAEADNLIEQRLKEVRLVFVTSLAALVVAGFAMIASESEFFFSLCACVIFLFTGWHAAKSDEGTVLLYQRYTGLEVKDRWNHNWREQMFDLLLPFGFGNHSSAKQYQFLRERADPAVSAFVKAGQDHRRNRGSLIDGGGGLGADDAAAGWGIKGAISRGHMKKAKLASTRAREYTRRGKRAPKEVPKDNGLTSPTSVQSAQSAKNGDDERGGMFGWLDTDGLQEVSASLIQNVWRAGKVDKSKDLWYADWLFKTASGSGPVEKLREAWSNMNATGSTRAPSLPDLPVTDPRFSRWFVLTASKGTLSIFTTENDHLVGAPAKGEVKQLRAYAVLRLKAADGTLILALLPRSALETDGPPPSSPSAVHASATSDALTAAEGKSWYIKGKDAHDTTTWFKRLEDAGARAVDTVHEASRKLPEWMQAVKPTVPRDSDRSTPRKPIGRNQPRGVTISAPAPRASV